MYGTMLDRGCYANTLQPLFSLPWRSLLRSGWEPGSVCSVAENCSAHYRLKSSDPVSAWRKLSISFCADATLGRPGWFSRHTQYVLLLQDFPCREFCSRWSLRLEFRFLMIFVEFVEYNEWWSRLLLTPNLSWGGVERKPFLLCRCSGTLRVNRGANERVGAHFIIHCSNFTRNRILRSVATSD